MIRLSTPRRADTEHKRVPGNGHRCAAALGRDYKNVHTDVARLLERGLLECDEGGTLRAPFDEIVILAGIRDAAYGES